MDLSKQESGTLKWPEVYSLGALNAAVVISWIAYHEYQPVLLEKFSFQELAEFLVISKAIILVVIPPLAGLMADLILRKNGKFFTVFSVGIGATAMVFMVVASIIGAGPLSTIQSILPVMIVVWLIAMNLFISPANSMIEAFAPAKKLPVVMGFLFLVTELLYALEPIIVSLVRFFGDTLTFIVGAILIGSTGYIFHKVSSNKVMTRKKELLDQSKNQVGSAGVIGILVAGIVLGLNKSLLVEFFPALVHNNFPDFASFAEYLAFGLLGLSAITGFVISRYLGTIALSKVLIRSFVVLGIGTVLILVAGNFYLMMLGSVIIAFSFSLINITGLPYAINNLSVRNITYGVGIFIGSSEIFTGIFEYYF